MRHHWPKLRLLPVADPLAPPPTFQQNGAAGVVEWAWDARRQAYVAPRGEPPNAGGRDFVQIAFISDTHGCHDLIPLMGRPAVVACDVLCALGDNIEARHLFVPGTRNLRHNLRRADVH